MKYAYPAIFTKEDGVYSVSFPDIEECVTCGDTLPDAIRMAEDALCLTLYDREEDNEDIPNPSDIRAIANEFSNDDNAIISMVFCDTLEYRKLYNNKAVKKTLTIPAWLNTMAERQEINFSTILQNALKRELNIM